jgi:hypothetical protein
MAQEADAARRRREEAAAKYRPDRVRLLLVAEAPPAALDRYFYFEDVTGHDALFRHVVRALLGLEPARAAKGDLLQALTERGVFLMDLKPDPKVGAEPLGGFVEDLVARAVALRPRHVITIKANVCALTQEPLRAAGLAVSEERIPFPSSGHQQRFLATMGRALERIGWDAGAEVQ